MANDFNEECHKEDVATELAKENIREALKTADTRNNLIMILEGELQTLRTSIALEKSLQGL